MNCRNHVRENDLNGLNNYFFVVFVILEVRMKEN